IGAAEIVQGSYESARQSLEPLAASADVTPEIRIVLGRVYLRLGDFEGARRQLEQASGDVRRTGELGINALIDAALEELNDELGESGGALAAYRRVASVAGSPSDLVAEATCRAAALTDGTSPAEHERQLLALISAARSSGRRLVAEKCSVDMALIYLRQRQY